MEKCNHVINANSSSDFCIKCGKKVVVTAIKCKNFKDNYVRERYPKSSATKSNPVSSCETCKYFGLKIEQKPCRGCDCGSNWERKSSFAKEDLPLSQRRTADGIMPSIEEIWQNANVFTLIGFDIWFEPYLKELEKYTEK